MDDPPASDSPRNILNVLNDDCIGEIFRRLTIFEDFLNAAETCERFQRCAMNAEYKFKSIDITKRTRFNRLTNIQPYRAPALLQNFGHLIKSIVWEGADGVNFNHNGEIFESIVRFCGETLKKLVIYNYNPKFNERNQFRILESLELINSKSTEILSCEQKLWFIQRFSHLQHVYFSCNNQLTDEMLTEFLSLNRQLQVFNVNCCAHVSPVILKSIGNYASSLHTLNIYWGKGYVINENNVKHLKMLRNLKEMTLKNGRLSLKFLLNMFAENMAPIRYLNIDVMDEEMGQNLPTLETLKSLSIQPFRFNHTSSDDIVINLAMSQTALETIHIYGDDTVTMQAIIKILKFGKNLTKIELWSDFTIDLQTYNEILNLTNNRVKVKCLVRKVEVPKDILDANTEWLHIIG